MIRQFGYALLLCLGLIIAPPVSAQTDKPFRHVTIATGNETGVYFPAGGAICRMVNRNASELGFRCSLESTDGSTFNLDALRKELVDFAIVQSDQQYHAFFGTESFKNEGPHKAMRSVFALHPEAFTVLARKDSGIEDFEDIRGKRVNVGSEGTGQRATLESLLDAYGWKMSDFSEALEYKASDQPRMLCAGKIDVMLYVVGHPSGAVKEATTLCDSVVLSLRGKAINKLISKHPYYRKTMIPGGLYRHNPESIWTFGVAATFITRENVPEEVVYALVKAVFENLDLFRRLHPALADLKPESMIRDGLTAPLHPGAEKYYREKGWIR